MVGMESTNVGKFRLLDWGVEKLICSIVEGFELIDLKPAFSKPPNYLPHKSVK